MRYYFGAVAYRSAYRHAGTKKGVNFTNPRLEALGCLYSQISSVHAVA